MQIITFRTKKTLVGINDPQNPYFLNTAPKKITLNQFWQSTRPMAVRCKQKQDLDFVCAMFDKMGQTWCDGESYLSNAVSVLDDKPSSGIFLTNNNRWQAYSEDWVKAFKKSGGQIFKINEIDWQNKKTAQKQTIQQEL